MTRARNNTLRRALLSAFLAHASCAALKAMRADGLSVEDEDGIARWLQAEGGEGFLYKAGGADLWQRTLACAGVRTR